MQDSIERLSLDIHNTSSGETVHAKRGYTAKTLIISLVDGGLPYIIHEDCNAVFTGKKPDGRVVINDCAIKDNTIVYSFTEQTVAVNGRMNCEIQLFGADGRLIISPKFTIIVSGPVYNEGDEIDSTDEITAKHKKAVLFIPQDLTEEEKAQARKNINAAQAFGQTKVQELVRTHAPGIDKEDTYGLHFSGPKYAPVELMHLLDGQSDDSAATVGQVKDTAVKAAVDILLELGLVPALADADGAVLAESSGAILINL